MFYTFTFVHMCFHTQPCRLTAASFSSVIFPCGVCLFRQGFALYFSQGSKPSSWSPYWSIFFHFLISAGKVTKCFDGARLQVQVWVPQSLIAHYCPLVVLIVLPCLGKTEYTFFKFYWCVPHTIYSDYTIINNYRTCNITSMMFCFNVTL